MSCFDLHTFTLGNEFRGCFKPRIVDFYVFFQARSIQRIKERERLMEKKNSGKMS